MKLYDENKEREYGLADCVKSRLQQTGYHSGEVESAREIADQCARAMGQLVDLLASKGVLSHDEALGFTEYNNSWNPATLKP